MNFEDLREWSLKLQLSGMGGLPNALMPSMLNRTLERPSAGLMEGLGVEVNVQESGGVL